MNDTPTTNDDKGPAGERDKLPYTAPELTEHGSARDVTLQTFFGSFSPTPV